MASTDGSTQPTNDELALFIVELSRLEKEVQRLGRLLDDVETDVWRVLNGVVRDRSEVYR